MKKFDMEAKELLLGGWGQTLEKVAVNCSAPLFWVENSESKEQVIHNGTIFFLDTGSHCFAVSAYHVYEDYLKAVDEKKNPVCQIAGGNFNPSDCMLDFSKDHDLITFNISLSLVSKIGKQFFKGHQVSWPPDPPQENKGVFFAGYPGVERRFDGPFNITFGIFRGICVVNSVGVDNITVHFDPKYAVDRPDQIPQGFNSGGMSGAPLISIVESRCGIIHWRLAGVIYEAQPSWDVMLAKRADFILEDGILRK